jgi:predicted phage terminase large subunit-like protein
VATASLDVSRLTDEELLDAANQRRAVAERRKHTSSLVNFTEYTNPEYETNWHHVEVGAALDRVLEGKCRRLMIFEPPQNGKSEQVSRRFPAYAFGKRPNLRIIGVSYGDTLANDMSRDVQKIMDTKEYKTLFPKVRLAESGDPEKRTQGQWDVVGGSGYYIGAGIMGGITGKTSDIGLIDDPIKNRAEAESETFRDRVWEQYKSAFATRQFGDQGAIVICLTRWHEDDLAGRLLKLSRENPDAEQWEVISFSAVAEQPHACVVVTSKDDPPCGQCSGCRHVDPRAPGDALWPSKYPLPELRRRRAGMGEYDWSALYQQHPAPSGGGLFKETWFAGKILDAAPALMRIVRGWDTASKEDGGDWTVGVKMGEEFVPRPDTETGRVSNVSTGRFIVLDVARDQLGPAGVDDLIKLTADLDGRKIAQREEKEGGSAGAAVIAARLKTLKGHDYAGVLVSGSKITRSKPFRAQCEGGNVYLLRGPWNRDYITELCGFPTANHDDQVDGSSCAFNAVLMEPVPEEEFVTW